MDANVWLRWRFYEVCASYSTCCQGNATQPADVPPVGCVRLLHGEAGNPELNLRTTSRAAKRREVSDNDIKNESKNMQKFYSIDIGVIRCANDKERLYTQWSCFQSHGDQNTIAVVMLRKETCFIFSTYCTHGSHLCLSAVMPKRSIR